MIFQCPGSGRFKEPYPEAIKCSACGKETEIWSDEVKANCFNCGSIISRDMQQGCFLWCKHAKECIGQLSLFNYYNVVK
jgi:predicted RNA-binding Zn-ribbon protein involved in translation (DUF1610 family)